MKKVKFESENQFYIFSIIKLYFIIEYCSAEIGEVDEELSDYAYFETALGTRTSLYKTNCKVIA